MWILPVDVAATATASATAAAATNASATVAPPQAAPVYQKNSPKHASPKVTILRARHHDYFELAIVNALSYKHHGMVPLLLLVAPYVAKIPPPHAAVLDELKARGVRVHVVFVKHSHVWVAQVANFPLINACPPRAPHPHVHQLRREPCPLPPSNQPAHRHRHPSPALQAGGGKATLG